MRFSLFSIAIIFLVLLVLAACKDEQVLENAAPETRIFLDDIGLSGTNRLNSVVRLHWSGIDKDGYVKGYEISFDNVNWEFVTHTDSTFRFSLERGTDTIDITFYVRAIDDQDIADPTPAFLRVPIRNTAPNVELDELKAVPDSVYSAFSVLWSVEDFDGNETLESVEVKLNDGEWLMLDPRTTFLTLVPSAPMQAGSQSARIFSGTNAQELSAILADLRVEANNYFFIRATDNAGAQSVVDTSSVFFVRRQSSDLLLVDAHDASGPDEVYLPLIQDIYGGFDRINLKENIPPFWNPTFGIYLSLYDKVFWYDDGEELADQALRLLLDVAANQIQIFLNNEGKLMTTARFPASYSSQETGNQSLIFDFSPMDSLSTLPQQGRIAPDATISPRADFASTFPALTVGSIITGADPYYAKDTLNAIYTAPIRSSGGWRGPNVVAGRSLNSNGNTNQIFFSIELHRLGRDPEALRGMMEQVLLREFAW